MGGFRDLKVWQKSKELAVLIYGATQERVFRRDFGFKDQIRRAGPSAYRVTSQRGMNAVLIKMLLDFST
jgi:hypothetical protein